MKSTCVGRLGSRFISRVSWHRVANFGGQYIFSPMFFSYLIGINIHIFFYFSLMVKDKATECSGHLMVSDQSRPRPHVLREELQVRCRPLR